MDPKLAMLAMLIGAIIGLSHLTEENIARLRERLAAQRWRKLMPVRRKI